jgi:hypothetical protein
MAQKKLRYDLLLRSLKFRDNLLDYWEWKNDLDYDDYDYHCGDIYYECLDFDSLYHESMVDSFYISKHSNSNYRKEMIRFPYRIVDMASIYPVEKIREIKIDKILGLSKDIKKVSLYDFYLKSKDKKK